MLGVRNFSVPFYVDDPGLLSGSWDDAGQGPGFTTLLYLTSAYHATNSRVSGDVDCSGTSVGHRASDAARDAINCTARNATYTLVWEGPNLNDSPYVVVVTPIVLAPSPW